MSNAQVFLKMYQDLHVDGQILAPRGQKIKEVQDYQMVLDMSPDDSPCTGFRDRKFSLPYAKKEFAWYLRADKYDRSIEKHASLWPKIIQPDGTYFSNYGQYIFKFPAQYDWVVTELMRDPDSRRASVILLRREHLFPENKDVVCTYGLNFRIRGSRLNVSVHMRSNDAIFGTSNDVFAFSMLYRMVLANLRFLRFRDLEAGYYAHKVDSLHVYERHWDMVEAIVKRGEAGYTLVPVPAIDDPKDLEFLLRHQVYPERVPGPELKFSHWLLRE